MASSISDDEFVLIQNQLIELRTKNYDLENNYKRAQQDNAVFQGKCEILDKELQRTSKAISKSKKAQEVQLLLQDNDALQKKLHLQEEEFRLQNQTLMQEISLLITEKDKLAKEASSLNCAPSENEELVTEIRRLTAENLALKSNKPNEENNILQLKEKIALLTSINEKLGKDAHSAECIPSIDENGGGDTGMQSKACDVSLTTLWKNAEERCTNLELELEPLKELQLKLEIEKGEKSILIEQINESKANEKELRQNIEVLQNEIAKVSDKLKKKQESVIQLQEEKEKQFTESRDSLEQLRRSSERDIEELKLKLESAENRPPTLAPSTDPGEEQLALQERCQEFEATADSLRISLDASEAEKEKLGDLLQKCQVELGESQEQRQTLQAELKALGGQLTDTNKVCESRKGLIDELAVKLSSVRESHAAELGQITSEYKTEVERITTELDEERLQNLELAQCRQAKEELEAEVRGLEDAKAWFEKRLNESEEEVGKQKEASEDLKRAHQGAVSSLEKKHAEEVEEMENQHRIEIELLRSQFEEQAEQRGRAEEEAAALRQGVKDAAEEVRICERKSSMAVKDLRRQLQSERKRCEKMEERLKEFLDGQHELGGEGFLPPGLNHPPLGTSSPDGGSSAGSWSMVSSGGNNKRHAQPPALVAATAAAPSTGHGGKIDGEADAAAATNQQDDCDALVDKLAALQQHKWLLEEKVSHLEAASSSMAEDLVMKTAIIQHYIMDHPHYEAAGSSSTTSTSPEKLSLRRVVDFIRDKTERLAAGDSDVDDMNKRLQRMLEETLTKNMHLEKDVSALSDEIFRIRSESSDDQTKE